MSEHGMADLAVSILRWVDAEPQPGIVEFALVDGLGREWRFIDKQAIASAEFLDANSAFPRPGSIRCTILALEADTSSRPLARIDTERPWGIEAVDGTHVYEVEADRLDRNAPQLEDERVVGLIQTIVFTAEKK